MTARSTVDGKGVEFNEDKQTWIPVGESENQEVVQWFANGDHPEDNCSDMTEGALVRRFRHPDIAGNKHCETCGNIMHLHGWIDSGVDGHTVCPGDWIVEVSPEEYRPQRRDAEALPEP